MGTMETSRKKNYRGACLARLMERVTLGLWGCEFKSRVGHRVYLKKKMQCFQEVMSSLGAGCLRLWGFTFVFLSVPKQGISIFSY